MHRVPFLMLALLLLGPTSTVEGMTPDEQQLRSAVELSTQSMAEEHQALRARHPHIFTQPYEAIAPSDRHMLDREAEASRLAQARLHVALGLPEGSLSMPNNSQALLEGYVADLLHEMERLRAQAEANAHTGAREDHVDASMPIYQVLASKHFLERLVTENEQVRVDARAAMVDLTRFETSRVLALHRLAPQGDAPALQPWATYLERIEYAEDGLDLDIVHPDRAADDAAAAGQGFSELMFRLVALRGHVMGHAEEVVRQHGIDPLRDAVLEAVERSHHWPRSAGVLRDQQMASAVLERDDLPLLAARTVYAEILAGLSTDAVLHGGALPFAAEAHATPAGGLPWILAAVGVAASLRSRR